MKKMSEKRKQKIFQRYQEIVAEKGIGVDFATLSDEDAMAYLLPLLSYSESEARFFLALAKGRLPNKIDNIDILY
jgi:hypothetical protein